MNALVTVADMNVNSARLPDVYCKARYALAECSRIDECQSWANKAEALASYARQANDDELRKMADRIQARALRRAGELLKQIPSGSGAYQSKQVGALPFVTRTSAAEEAGLSEHQRKTALRVASVDGEAFEAQVESDEPPTITSLAEQGTQRRTLVDLGGIEPAMYARATEAIGTVRRFAEFCAKHDPQQIACAIKDHEARMVRQRVHAIDAWLDVFVVNLKEC